MTGPFPHRRHVLAGLTGSAAFALLSPHALAQTKAKLVVVGGGFGGATAARYLKTYLPDASVTLVEPATEYVACPFSNLVIGGVRDISQQRFTYDSLKSLGIDVIHARASDVNAEAGSVTLDNGDTLAFDRLVLSPGIDIRWVALEGYDEAAAEIMPHAWKAGPQTSLLRQQLEDMEDGGLVVMSVPLAPFRCPPGPYERASLIAHYLKTTKPNSKLLVLDAKDEFSKKPLFLEAWAEHYPDHLEWRSASDFGRTVSVNTATMTLSTDFDVIKADVANVIPPQKAGLIAERAGVADETGWCPINPLDFSSPLQPNIHVIGDATIAAPMPKSAFSANLQGKLCALQIARALSGKTLAPTVLANTCYSYTTPDEAVSITGVYNNGGSSISSVEGAGGVSPYGADFNVRNAEAEQAEAWFATITSDTFG
ncbi:NAD(P)/FAD-dependent oxidoreductase [Henriciella litoralis]|uniref:NAD(P)/FAD-dependent oxidoreductase n=1 Tax=Henriciella litoralis TaxID=568102 RepID=UPI0009FC6DA7|nr:NAD(P)/FAD-dependent oxidoreductase [Henriciella litoralis]